MDPEKQKEEFDSLFEQQGTDAQFESKLSAWKSYCTERSKNVFDEGSLENPVAEGVEDHRQTVKPFWCPPAEELEFEKVPSGFNGSVEVRSEESQQTIECGHSKENVDIEMNSMKRCAEDEVVKKPRVGDSVVAAKAVPVIVSTLLDRTTIVTQGTDRNQTGITEEIIGNLEAKIKLLEAQVTNYKQAMHSKELQMKNLKVVTELQASGQQMLDQEYVEMWARSGLEMVKRLRKYEIPCDMSETVARLKIENMDLKCIIEELAARLEQK